MSGLILNTPIKDFQVNKMNAERYEEMKAAGTLPPNSIIVTPEHSTINLPIGAIFPSALPILDASVHLLDGSTIAQNGVYADFVTLLKTLVSSGYNISCSQTKFDEDVAIYGQCGKFVIDDTAGTIRLPKVTKFIQGLDSITNIGIAELDSFKSHTHAVSLPTYGVSGSWASAKDLLVSSSTGKNAGSDNQTTMATGDSETKPKNIKYPYYIVLAGGYKNIEQVNINNVVSDLNLLKSEMFIPGAITCLTFSGPTISKASAVYKIPHSKVYESPNLNGRLIPDSSDVIKIGAGVKMVKISAFVQFYVNYIGYSYVYIYKNGSQYLAVYEQQKDSGYRAMPMTLAPLLLEVEEGDEVYVAYSHSVANNNVQRAYYTVEVVG